MDISCQDIGLIQGNSRYMHCACDYTVVSRHNTIRKLDLDIPLQNRPDYFL